MTRRRGDNEVVSMIDDTLHLFGPRFIKFLNVQLHKIKCYHPGCDEHILYSYSNHTIYCVNGKLHSRHVSEISQYFEPIKEAIRLFRAIQRLQEDMEEERLTIHDLWLIKKQDDEVKKLSDDIITNLLQVSNAVNNVQKSIDKLHSEFTQARDSEIEVLEEIQETVNCLTPDPSTY